MIFRNWVFPIFYSTQIMEKGKKLHDKRESMKKKDHDRELKLIKII